MIKKIIYIALLAATTGFAGDGECRSLYDDFMAVLEPQLTVLCNTGVDGVYNYRFYVRSEEDGVGYTGMELVFWEGGYHLYMDGDDNPFACRHGGIYRTQRPEEIARILFIPRQDCSDEFKRSIGVDIEEK